MIIRVNINLSSFLKTLHLWLVKLMRYVKQWFWFLVYFQRESWYAYLNCISQHALQFTTCICLYHHSERERVSFNERVSFDTAVHNMLLFISSFRERESLIDTAVHNMHLFISSFRERESQSVSESQFSLHSITCIYLSTFS